MANCAELRLQYSFGFALTLCIFTAISTHTTQGLYIQGSVTQSDDVDYESNYRIFVTAGDMIINSTFHPMGYYDKIAVTLFAFKETFVLDLQINTYLCASNYTQKAVTISGVELRKPNRTEDDCHYIGKVKNRDPSVAAVSTCKGILGYFAIGDISYYIDPVTDTFSGPYLVYRSRVNDTRTFACGTTNEQPSFVNYGNLQKRKKRAFLWPQNQDKVDKVVKLYICNDFSQYNNYGDVNTVFDRTKAIVNMASADYQPFGVYLTLTGIEVWATTDLIFVNRNDSGITLYNWLAYRRESINPQHINDVGVLLTANIFPGGVIGKSMLWTMCSFNDAGIIVSDIELSPALAGTTMAHEIGHSFGLIHDTDSCACDDPSGHCIMNAVTIPFNPPTFWSQCSKDQLAFSFEHGMDICLYDVPLTLVLSNVATCGNGIVEIGEQCDCGNAANDVCNHSCCDPTTCQLIYPAQCAYGRCCNVSRCQILPVWSVCRAKSDDCDLAEFCDGINALCPVDTYKPDGTDCFNLEPAYCYHGLCRSSQSQCELIWGPGTTESNSFCYALGNVKGNQFGDCGMNWRQSNPVLKCGESDFLCGRLQCNDNSRNLNYYLNSVAVSAYYIGPFACHSAVFDYGLQTQDPALVPNGAKCNDDMMCINQTCVNVAYILQSLCPLPCQPTEVCNNIGQCQRTIPDTSPTTATATSSTTTTSTTTTTTTTTQSSSPSTTTTTTVSTPTTSTSTSTTTTTPTTTTPVLGEGAFGVYLGTSSFGAMTPLHQTGALANRLSRYNFTNDQFKVWMNYTAQYIYTEICAGIIPATTAQLMTLGAYPTLTLDWFSTSQNGVDTACRGGVLWVTGIISISLNQVGGGVYSSNQRETTWSMFSITDTMKYDSQLLNVLSPGPSNIVGNLPFQSPLVNPFPLYNAATTAYTCSSDAPAYFFSMSVGVPSGGSAAVQLLISGMNYTFEMTRQTIQTSGNTTLARSILIPCKTDARMWLSEGGVVPGGGNLISFTAFPYEMKTGFSVAWGGYRSSNVTSSGTITFDTWLVVINVFFTDANRQFLVPVGGYYYVYISAGVFPGLGVAMSVMRNGQTMFGLTRTATNYNGLDTIGHGMVVLLSAGDILRVDTTTTLFSSSPGLHTCFMGMLLYPE